MGIQMQDIEASVFLSVGPQNWIGNCVVPPE